MAGEGVKGPASLYRILVEQLRERYQALLRTFDSVVDFEKFWAEIAELVSLIRAYEKEADKAEKRSR
jgi:hypothetical protein